MDLKDEEVQRRFAELQTLLNGFSNCDVEISITAGRDRVSWSRLADASSQNASAATRALAAFRFLALPRETQDQVTKSLTRKDLIAISSTCRGLRARLEPAVFSSVCIHAEDRDIFHKRLSGLYTNGRRLIRFTRSLSIHLPVRELEFEGSWLSPFELRQLFYSPDVSLKQLHTLRLCIVQGNENDNILADVFEASPNLNSPCWEISLPSLRRLGNWVTFIVPFIMKPKDDRWYCWVREFLSALPMLNLVQFPCYNYGHTVLAAKRTNGAVLKLEDLPEGENHGVGLEIEELDNADAFKTWPCGLRGLTADIDRPRRQGSAQ
ncbi:hypothetical protein CPLU01_03067 [Colletotrichum plurivorum]|uniref:F-box domain-containing protein n=1 Tax=Colletotrichum plurivorum TaxID=2175906 RepID=A0A8H6KUL4_9PEZI|nr:hypothetical protein CPLU01_03067 [Colletotrichum plurivorum]